MSQALHHGTGQICTCRQPADWSSSQDAAIRSVRRVMLNIGGCMERSRQRQALRGLDDHQLKDIGLSRAIAMEEARKPFWM